MRSHIQFSPFVWKSKALLFFMLLSLLHFAEAQLAGVVVEKYYIADQNDLTDTTGGRSLPAGAVTYRVYVKITPGSRLTGVYGSPYHPMEIRSTADFYNNNDRPSSNYGYKLKSSWYEDNPTLALDSWLTLAYATDTKKGVLKSLDPDGDLIAGLNNTGGTAMLSTGLLANTDTAMGVPLTTADGLTAATTATGMVPAGFTDFGGNDTTIFGPDSLGSVFICSTCAIQNNVGLIGPAVDSNTVLVAQLTTAGELNFKLNVSILEPDGQGGTQTVNYVATDDTLLAGEVVSPYLSYPLACGCIDPNYLEYKATYSCSEDDSCKTLIRFGCMDTSACNYDPDANFNIPGICCYPGYCYDRDIALACPELNNGRNANNGFVIYPNPGEGQITMEIYSTKGALVNMTVLNAVGQIMFLDKIYLGEEITISEKNLSDLPAGIYFIHLDGEQMNSFVKFVKNN